MCSIIYIWRWIWTVSGVLKVCLNNGPRKWASPKSNKLMSKMIPNQWFKLFPTTMKNLNQAKLNLLSSVRQISKSIWSKFSFWKKILPINSFLISNLAKEPCAKFSTPMIAAKNKGNTTPAELSNLKIKRLCKKFVWKSQWWNCVAVHQLSHTISLTIINNLCLCSSSIWMLEL